MTGIINNIARELIDIIYPVNSIIEFIAETDPNVVIGHGTKWRRLVDGRTLIASDNSHPVGWTGGEFVHQLTASEMPAHEHGFLTAAWTHQEIVDNPGNNAYSYRGETTNHIERRTFSVGGNTPHNNIQPSLAVCRWVREE